MAYRKKTKGQTMIRKTCI